MGVDRYRVCELYATSRGAAGSGSGYRLGERLVLTARHVIAPALAGPDGQLLVRPVGVTRWLSARVEWEDADADAALIGIRHERWQAPDQESMLRWGELAGGDPVWCAAVGFPWASARPDRMRDTAHLYGKLSPLGQLRQGRLDFDVASASPSAREGGSPWAGMSGAGVIADNHLVAMITVDPARYTGRLVAVPVGRLLADPGFRARLTAHGVQAEAAPVGAGWYLELPGGQTVSLAPAYRPVNRRFRPAPSTLLSPEHGLVPFLGRQAVLDQISGWCQGPPGTPVLLAAIVSMFLLRMSFAQVGKVARKTVVQMKVPIPTIACMLGLAYLMNYAGMTSTLGLALAATGKGFPFFSAVLGWLGVFLTGSDTSSNVLFGNLQQVTAQRLNLPPVLMASANSSGGVMGKMIDAQSIVVASVATGGHPKSPDAGTVLRSVFWHSLALAILIGILVMLQAYVLR